MMVQNARSLLNKINTLLWSLSLDWAESWAQGWPRGKSELTWLYSCVWCWRSCCGLNHSVKSPEVTVYVKLGDQGWRYASLEDLGDCAKDGLIMPWRASRTAWLCLGGHQGWLDYASRRTCVMATHTAYGLIMPQWGLGWLQARTDGLTVPWRAWRMAWLCL